MSTERNLREYHKKLLEIEKTVTEIKDVFDGLISRLYTGMERISELKDTSQSEM